MAASRTVAGWSRVQDRRAVARRISRALRGRRWTTFFGERSRVVVVVVDGARVRFSESRSLATDVFGNYRPERATRVSLRASYEERGRLPAEVSEMVIPGRRPRLEALALSLLSRRRRYG